MVKANRLAISDRAGSGLFFVDQRNRGMSKLIDAEISAPDKIESDEHIIQVPMARLDQVLLQGEVPTVIKIDVEGHELAVLQGADGFLGTGRVRDVLFEEHHEYPTATTDLLQSNGFSVLKIQKTFSGSTASPSRSLSHPWEPPNYLATRQPQRALRLAGPCGWMCRNASHSWKSPR